MKMLSILSRGHRTRLVLVLVGASLLGYAQENTAPAISPMLEVFADHYELNGIAYKTAGDLMPALRQLKDKKVLFLHWFANASDEAKKAAIAVKVKEAAQAAKDAGIERTGVISNEVF